MGQIKDSFYLAQGRNSEHQIPGKRPVSKDWCLWLARNDNNNNDDNNRYH